MKQILIRDKGCGKGAVVYNLLVNTPVKVIVAAGHGPLEAPEMQQFQNNYPGATIYCMEPDKRNWIGLKEKYAKTRVKVFQCAVGDVDGDVEFYENMGKGQSSMLPWKRCTPTYTVKSVTLDTFAESHGLNRINHLFLDVQGSEHLVFEGAKKLLGRHAIGVIVGEAVITNNYGTPDSFYIAYGILRDAGYKFVGVYEITQGRGGRVHKFDYIFALPHLVTKLDEL